MLALFRRFLNTWAARAFFLVLVGSFAIWGIGDVVRNVGGDTAVATIGDRKIEPQELQDAYRRGLSQVTRMFGGRMEPTPEIRRAVAAQALDRLVLQAAMQQEARALGLAVSDEALRQAVYDIPAFRTPAGFSRAQFDAVLRNNGWTEGRFVEELRKDLTVRQLTGAVRAGAAAPDVVAREVFAYQQERRVAEYVDLPFAAADEPSPPTEDDLRRQYDNDPQGYTAPEYRRIKAVILSAETLARGIEVSDEDLRAYYDQHRTEFVSPEKRSVQVIVSQDEAAARRLAEQWMTSATGGTDWNAIQAAAAEAGASTVALEDATQAEFPDPELARAVFAAAPETVSGPVHGTLGWQVVRVTRVQPGAERSFDETKDELRGRVAQERAADQVYSRAQQVEDLIASGAKLEDLPGDLGLAAVSGTLDKQGNTPEGEPAPLPGGPQLRQALVAAAFQASKGAPPVFTEAPDRAWFAVEVEDITPGARKPFEEVEATVREDWLRGARRRAQEAVAAKLLAAVKGGQSLDDAATVAGVRLQRTEPVSRTTPAPGLPAQANDALFTQKPGEPTMIEAGERFVVLVPTDRQVPAQDSDPAGFAAARSVISRSLGDDMEQVFAAAVRDSMHPRVNRAALDGITDR